MTFCVNSANLLAIAQWKISPTLSHASQNLLCLSAVHLCFVVRRNASKLCLAVFNLALSMTALSAGLGSAAKGGQAEETDKRPASRARPGMQLMSAVG